METLEFYRFQCAFVLWCLKGMWQYCIYGLTLGMLLKMET